MSASKTKATDKHLADDIQQRDIGRLKPHPDADLIPPMTPDEYDGLVEDIEQRGIVDPLVVTDDDTILDGRHRLMAAKVIGLETVPVRKYKGDATEQRDFMLRAALLRRHLTTAQRKALAVDLIKAEPAKSDRSIAKATGISRPTVANIRDDLEAHDEVAEFATSTGADGKSYPRPVVVSEGPGNPEADISADYDDLFAHADDPKVRYRLGEKLQAEKVDGDYPKGRLKDMAKRYDTRVGMLKQHVAYWEAAMLVRIAIDSSARTAAERWFEFDDVHDIRPLTIDEVIPAIPADERKKLRATLRRGIKNFEKMVEALR